HSCSIAKVVIIPGCTIIDARKRGDDVRLDRNELGIILAFLLIVDEGESKARKVTAAADTGDHLIGRLVDLLKLCPDLLADDGLVKHDVVQHTAQSIFGIRRAYGGLN